MTGMYAPAPKSLREVSTENTHPGLALDKYARSWSDNVTMRKLSENVQKPTVDEVIRLTALPTTLDWAGLVARRNAMLKALESRTFLAVTAGPFTLHLSRASALENAGICLHPLYGFVYLPGTGVKGMARAFAQTIWLPSCPNQQEGWELIDSVFGWANSKERRERLQEFSRPALPEPAAGAEASNPNERAGSVVFHDAWPLRWPRLQGDIVNSHHSKYYSAAGNDPPPGDWESPVPVAFLAVGSGETFQFAVSPRRNAPPAEMEWAQAWLMGALEHLGAGAKTAAGYGHFQVDPKSAEAPRLKAGKAWRNSVDRGDRAESPAYELELVTPAFLAGLHGPNDDDFDPAECTLRTATLRGQLRWWWRTMHAAWLDVKSLRRLEAAVWGDTSGGGAVRLLIEPCVKKPPCPFNRTEIVSQNRLPAPPYKTTQGLTYHTFGMDEKKDDRHVRRYFVPPGASWTVRLIVRSSRFAHSKSSINHLSSPPASNIGLDASGSFRRRWFQIAPGARQFCREKLG